METEFFIGLEDLFALFIVTNASASCKKEEED